ncbi:MAG: hypothetical protein HY330_02455 [Chloroflexi bacterium]|nr:hypothetical protein [Chloroflexota bacterium]
MNDKKASRPTKRDWPVTIFWLALPAAALLVYALSQRWWVGVAVFVLGFAAFAIWAQRTGRLDRME